MTPDSYRSVEAGRSRPASTELRLQVPDDLIDALADAVLARLADYGQPPAPEPWALLNLEQAAARLGRSPRWTRQKAKDGELPWIRLDGGALAFELTDLQAFAASRRIPLQR